MGSKSDIKSNIKIKSNLYIRGTADGSFSFADEDYTARINSRDALMKLKDRAVSSGANLKLTVTQQGILSGAIAASGGIPSIGSSHSNDSLPESVSMRNIEDLGQPVQQTEETAEAPDALIQPAGPLKPDGELIPGNISMNIPNIPANAAEDISEIPEIVPIRPAETAAKPEKTREEKPESRIQTPAAAQSPASNSVPVSIPDPSKVNAAPAEKILAVSLDEIPEPVIENIIENTGENIGIGLDGFSEISDTDAAEKAVKAPLDSRIILDSVCCSEKIKLVSDRAAFIAENHPDKKVLVLCKTETAAVRISRAVEKYSGSDNLNIATLEVFAAKYLSGLEVPAAKIVTLSDAEKTALFSEKMRTEDFSDYDFCIIPDLDEIIAENVKTLLKILVLLECGFLMLTDRRRSALIYMPESGHGNYEKNFAKLCDVLPESTEKLAITDTKHRLSGEIGGLLAAITAGKPAEDAKKELLSKMRSADLSKLAHTDGDTAVLCKNSGCAKYVSLMLRKNGIRHTLLSEERPTPVRQLADILWDTHEKVIARDNFIKRFVTRCGSGEAHADEMFDMLCGLIKRDPSEGLELARLAEVIMLGGIPMSLVNAANENELTVTVTGSVSSRVFNTVFILADDETVNGSSGTLLYLAAAGRAIPPALLKLKDMPELISGSDNRCVCLNGGQKPLFSLGNTGDADYRSFIGGSMGDAVRKQAYISKNVKPGDDLTLALNGEAYDIVHGGTVIGKMSESFSKSLLSEYGGKKYLEALPDKIEGAYAANIFTVVSCCDPSEYEGLISPQFREHHFWYGVEIGGFGY